MSDTIIKAENEDNNVNDDSLCALTKILQEVKKEEQAALSDDETEKNRVEALPESFFDDLYREELEADPAAATTEEDIQILEELIARRKRILDEELHGNENGGREKSHSSSPDRRGVKRKQIETDTESDVNKRVRQPSDTSQVAVNSNEPPEPPPTQIAEAEQNNSTEQQHTPTNDYPAAIEEPTDPEIELENLLKTEDYNSDDDTSNTNQKMQFTNTMNAMYGMPNAMLPTMYNSAPNQMMPNMAPGGYPMMCNMGFPQPFYPPNMMNMQMMGFGLPQMNVPPDDSEVQCLPVSGLSKIPFRKIKLEKTDKTVAPAGDPKRKIIAACTLLLEKLEFPEPTGKFVYTSTVTQINNTAASNSILMKITNVSYNFQSIGPKQNIQEWGLKGIPSANIQIAKEISMSADKYFLKISENANTIARKLIKQEVIQADKNEYEKDIEEEELSLSSYFKNATTQTNPLVCQECVVRKRKVGHEIAVQASVFSGNVATQTSRVYFNDKLTEGLSDNQLKAMHEFSCLIREPARNTSVELIRLRDQLLNIYNLAQRQQTGLAQYLDSSNDQLVRNPVRHSMIEQSSISDPRLAHRGGQIPIRHQAPIQAYPQNMPNYPQHEIHHGGQYQNIQPVPIPPPIQNDPASYSQQMMQFPYQQNAPPHFPGQIRNDHAIQIPIEQRRNVGHASQYPDHAVPEFPSHEFQPQEGNGRKKYGRGALRR